MDTHTKKAHQAINMERGISSILHAIDINYYVNKIKNLIY